MSNNFSGFRSEEARIKTFAAYEADMTHWPVAFESRHVKTQYGNAFVIISGQENKKPLILLHGGSGNSSMWEINIADLAKHFTVYAIDIIGEAGKSEGERLSYQTEKPALWLKEVIESLNIKQAAVCGTSLGGMLAHQFANQYPEMVSELILLAPPTLYSIKPAFILRALMVNLFQMDYVAKKFLYYVSTNAHQLPQRMIDSYVVRFKGYKPNLNPISPISKEELSQLPKKTLILIGDKEVLFDTNAVINRINNDAPHITTKIIPDASHSLSIDQPQLVNQLIINFALEDSLN